ncbi:MAG: Ig-like domain-containing protein [Bacteroidales bacterium]|nr:Ig-like domain-containing protein [Bacteroidales bacterium]
MKKFLTFLIIASIAIVFVLCKKYIPVTDVVLSQSVATRIVGDRFTLDATVLPNNATNKAVLWISSTPAVATVFDGTVTPLIIGTTTIISVTRDGNKMARCSVTVIPAQSCNTAVPGWGNNLGTVTRGTDEWKISGSGITQVWSDAVTATGCDKESFAGGDDGNFNADCRSNPDFPGDFFSWCAVYRFQDLLCPVPWRVPTTQDFVDLDIAMGGTGSTRIDLEFVTSKYLNSAIWNGAYGGYCTLGGTLYDQGSWAGYWSQLTDIHSVGCGLILNFTSTGSISMSRTIVKAHGHTLRCVR